MSVTTERPAGATAIRPLPRRHLGRHAGRSPPTHRRDAVAVQGTRRRSVAGVQRATSPALSRYWATEHDWRTCEAKLNALPQFTTEIDGVS
jgi:Epoxide hydrolase N terminus